MTWFVCPVATALEAHLSRVTSSHDQYVSAFLPGVDCCLYSCAGFVSCDDLLVTNVAAALWCELIFDEDACIWTTSGMVPECLRPLAQPVPYLLAEACTAVEPNVD